MKIFGQKLSSRMAFKIVLVLVSTLLLSSPVFSDISTENKSEYIIALQLALDEAIRAHVNTRDLGTQCRNEKEVAAWADCVELHENTVQKLNQTIEKYDKSTRLDSQTWLSAALTNLETCRSGFEELGVTEHLLPMLVSNNASKLIENCLAINRLPYGYEQKYKEGYPTWVSPDNLELLQSPSPASGASLVVARDGSGNVKTIQEAIDVTAKRTGSERFVIYVKAGTYTESVVVANEVKNVMLVGDGIGKTIVTGSSSSGGGSTTFQSATFAVDGDGFIARGITFRNTAGAANSQAVALRSSSDFSVFYQCSFEGYQDTLYVFSHRQFYRECNIYGTVDFIFGNAAAVFQNCNIYCRRPLATQSNTITAHSRLSPHETTGISIIDSKVMADSDLVPVVGSVQSFLGRPWKQYSRTVFMQTSLGSLIDPAGWLEWSGNFALDTLYYGEYENTGPGSSTANRAKWGGYHVITSATEASKFTVANFIGGNSWLPSTGVPFTSGL